MNMSIKPRYLIVAAVVAGGLSALGVSVGTLIFLSALAYMASMHLGLGGGHGGAGGHAGGCGGHAQSKPASDTSQTPSRQEPSDGNGHVGHR